MMGDEDVVAMRNDLLWALWAIARLGYPGSVRDLCAQMGQPSLADEYEAVRDKWWPKDRDAAERMGRA